MASSFYSSFTLDPSEQWQTIQKGIVLTHEYQLFYKFLLPSNRAEWTPAWFCINQVKGFSFSFLGFQKNKNLFYFQRERKGRDREGEPHQLPPKHPQPGSQLATQECALTGFKPVTIWFADDAQPTEPHHSRPQHPFLPHSLEPGYYSQIVLSAFHPGIT